MNDEIKKAIDICKLAQRNYDLKKRLPPNDLETLITIENEERIYYNKKITNELKRYLKSKIERFVNQKLTVFFSDFPNPKGDK